jgi:hypothetical protein
MFDLIVFMSDLHICHNCKYVIRQINGKGRQRTYCEKYRQPIKRVQWQCVDRYIGFDTVEISEMKRQYRAGKLALAVGT